MNCSRCTAEVGVGASPDHKIAISADRLQPIDNHIASNCESSQSSMHRSKTLMTRMPIVQDCSVTILAVR